MTPAAIVPMRMAPSDVSRAEGVPIKSARSPGRGEVKERAPLCRVGRSDEPARAGGTAAQAAFQASSCRGMHTTRRRDSLGLKHRLKRASEPSRAKQELELFLNLTSVAGASRGFLPPA